MTGSPYSCHIDVDVLIYASWVCLKSHFKTFLLMRDHTLKFNNISKVKSKVSVASKTKPKSYLSITSQEGISNSALHLHVIRSALFLWLKIQNMT